MVSKNTICLWFDGNAAEAAQFYAETFPDSSARRRESMARLLIGAMDSRLRGNDVFEVSNAVNPP